MALHILFPILSTKYTSNDILRSTTSPSCLTSAVTISLTCGRRSDKSSHRRKQRQCQCTTRKICGHTFSLSFTEADIRVRMWQCAMFLLKALAKQKSSFRLPLKFNSFTHPYTDGRHRLSGILQLIGERYAVLLALALSHHRPAAEPEPGEEEESGPACGRRRRSAERGHEPALGVQAPAGRGPTRPRCRLWRVRLGRGE